VNVNARELPMNEILAAVSNLTIKVVFPMRSLLLPARWLVVVLASAAWFAASNHCALAGRLERTCTACHGKMAPDHAPSKPQEKSDTPCCSSLQATMTSAAKNVFGFDRFSFVAADPFPVPASLIAARTREVPAELDTGPPHFTATLFARCFPSNAPPSLS
jgi:hypothetical protein